MSAPRDPDLTVMGLSGKIEILRPEDKLVLLVPELDQRMANAIDAHLADRLGKRRGVVLPDVVDVLAVPPGTKVVLRIPDLTDEVAGKVAEALTKVFGEDGFILLPLQAEVSLEGGGS